MFTNLCPDRVPTELRAPLQTSEQPEAWSEQPEAYVNKNPSMYYWIFLHRFSVVCSVSEDIRTSVGIHLYNVPRDKYPYLIHWKPSKQSKRMSLLLLFPFTFSSMCWYLNVSFIFHKIHIWQLTNWVMHVVKNQNIN